MDRDSACNQLPHRFQITGKTLRTILKQLKPAFPKKKVASLTGAMIIVRPDRVTFGLPGAQVGGPAVTSASFNVEIPFSELQWLMKDDFALDEQITFAFEPERMMVRGVGIGHPRIHVVEVPASRSEPPIAPTDGAPLAKPDAQSEFMPLEEPLDGFLGYPLLGIYRTLKKWPPGTFTGNRRIQEGEQEIEQILAKADKLLKPLGLGRDDIINLIEMRIGIAK
jgi:hypothetical protein